LLLAHSPLIVKIGSNENFMNFMKDTASYQSNLS
jgi:hypothetical protein